MRKGWIVGIVALVVVVVAAAGGYYLFFQSNVQSQVEQSVRRLFANPPAPYTKATFDKLDVALASRRLTIDDIVLERSTPPYVIKIGRFEATGIDTDNIQSIFDPAKYKDGAADQTFRKLADAVTLTKIDADSREGGKIAIDQFAAKGIQGHQFNVKPDPTVVAAMPERERTLMLLDAIRIDSFGYENLNTAGAQSPSGKVRRIDVTDFSRQGVGSIVADELDLVDPKDGTRTSWKRFEIRNIPGDPWFDFAITGKRPSDVMRLITLGGVKIDDLRVQPGKRGEPAIRIASLDMGKVDRKRLDSFTMTGFEATGPGGGATIGAMEIKGLNWEEALGLIGQKDWLAKIGDISYGIDKFSIRDVGGASMDMIGARLKEISLSGFVDRKTGKTESAFAIDSFEIDGARNKEPSIAMALKMLDYDKIKLSLDSGGAGDLNTGTTSIDKFRIFGPQVGEFNIAFAITDYKPPPAGKKPPSFEDALGPLMAAKVKSMKISWKDDSLTPRLLKAIGTTQGLTAEQLRAGAIAQVKKFGEAYKDDANVSAAIQAVVDYLNKPGSLIIEANPKTPPTFAEIGAGANDPANLPEMFRLLGLTVTSN